MALITSYFGCKKCNLGSEFVQFRQSVPSFTLIKITIIHLIYITQYLICYRVFLHQLNLALGDSNSTLFAKFQNVLDDEEETMLTYSTHEIPLLNVANLQCLFSLCFHDFNSCSFVMFTSRASLIPS